MSFDVKDMAPRIQIWFAAHVCNFANLKENTLPTRKPITYAFA
jgi:hypothetical protein